MSFQGFVSLSRDKTFSLSTLHPHDLQRKTSFHSREAPVNLREWFQVLLSVTENIVEVVGKDKKKLFVLPLDEVVAVGEFYSFEYILLELSLNRHLLFSKFPNSESSHDLFTTLTVRFSKPITTLSLGDKGISLHSDHFFHDEEKNDEPQLETMVEYVEIRKEEGEKEKEKDKMVIPFPITQKILVKQLAASPQHALAVTVEGQAYIWGSQPPACPVLGLGHSDRFTQETPRLLNIPFEKGESINTGVCGLLNTALISSKGRVAMWGRVVGGGKEKGREGGGAELEEVCVPEIFLLLKNKFVSMIATSSEATFAVIHVPGLDDITEVWVWGSNSLGLLGPQDKTQKILLPQEVTSLQYETIVDISVGPTHALCVNATGEVYVWGKNHYTSPQGVLEGLLGPCGSTDPLIQIPTKIDTFGPGRGKPRAKKVLAGYYQSVALTTCQKVFTWGYSGRYSGLGHDNTILKTKGSLAYLLNPTPLSGITSVEELCTDGTLFTAKTTGGKVFSWGSDENKAGTPVVSVDSTGDSFLLTMTPFQRKVLVVKGHSMATIVYKNEKKVFSASWHPLINHLSAFASRVWKKDSRSPLLSSSTLPFLYGGWGAAGAAGAGVGGAGAGGLGVGGGGRSGTGDGLVILDALGNCCAPGQLTTRVIERMVLAGVQPVFLVTEVKNLLKVYRGRLWLRWGGISWAETGVLMSLLFMFPSSIFSQTRGKESKRVPKVKVNFHSVFFLNYKERTKLTAKEILDFLLSSSARLEKICHCFDKLKQNDKVSNINKSSSMSNDKTDNNNKTITSTTTTISDNKKVVRDDEISSDEEGSDNQYDEEGDDDQSDNETDIGRSDGMGSSSSNINDADKEMSDTKGFEDIWESVLGGELFVESWIPEVLPKETREYIQTNLWRSRYLRIFKVLKNWLKYQPIDFFGSGQLMGRLLHFLQLKCDDQSDPEVASAALSVRRTFFLIMAENSEKFSQIDTSGHGIEEEKERKGSILLSYSAEDIANQLTYIDATILFSNFSIDDIFKRRAPQIARRFSLLSNWVEKELLECPKSDLLKMTEVVVELAYLLCQLRNLSSVVAVISALLQTPIKKLTGNVWEKGTKLTEPAASYYKWMKEEGVADWANRPPRCASYFEKLSEPKIPFIGSFWHRLFTISEKFKLLSPPSPPSSPPPSPHFSLSSLPSPPSSPTLSSSPATPPSFLTVNPVDPPPQLQTTSVPSLPAPLHDIPLPSSASTPTSKTPSSPLLSSANLPPLPSSVTLAPPTFAPGRKRSPSQPPPVSLETPAISVPVTRLKSHSPPLSASSQLTCPLPPSLSPRSALRSPLLSHATPAMFTPFFEPTREDEGNEEEEAEREVVMVERWRVETVEALWLKTVFDGCAKGYKIEPIPGLMDRLLNVKGFSLKETQHRQIADHYHRGMAHLDECTNPTSSLNTSTNNNTSLNVSITNSSNITTSVSSPVISGPSNQTFEGMYNEEEEEKMNLQSTLLTGQASFVSLSERLRCDLLEQWQRRIQEETPQLRKQTAGSIYTGSIAVPSLEWPQLRATLEGQKGIFLKCLKAPFPANSFPYYLLKSEALEVTAKTILQTEGGEKTFQLLEEILILLFEQPTLSKLFLEMIAEIIEFGNFFSQTNSLPGGYHETAACAVWRLIAFLKVFQSLLYDYETLFGHFSYFLQSTKNLPKMLNKWKTAAPDDYPRIEDDLWDCFTFLDDYLTILEDSFLRDIRDLDESEFSIPELDLISKMIGSSRTKKQIDSLQEHQRQGTEIMKLLQDQLNFTAKMIETKKEGKGEKLGGREEFKETFMKEIMGFVESVDGWKQFETDTCVQKLQKMLQSKLFPELRDRKNFIRGVLDFVSEQRNEAERINKTITVKRFKQLKSFPNSDKEKHREQYARIRNRIAFLEADGGPNLTLPSRSSLDDAKRVAPSLSKLRASSSFFKSQVEIVQVCESWNLKKTSSQDSSTNTSSKARKRSNTASSMKSQKSKHSRSTSTSGSALTTSSVSKAKKTKSHKREKSHGKTTSEKLIGQGEVKKGEGESALLGGMLGGAVSETVLGRKTVKSPVLFGKKKRRGKKEEGESEGKVK